MSKCYDTLTPEIRYTAYMQDKLDYSSTEKLTQSIWNLINGLEERILDFFRKMAGKDDFLGNSTGKERRACCQAFAHYLLAKSKSK